MNSGYNFLATVIAAFIVGFLIDKFAGTQPWGMLGFLVIGFVYATYMAQKAMQEDGNSETTEKDDKKS